MAWTNGTRARLDLDDLAWKDNAAGAEWRRAGLLLFPPRSLAPPSPPLPRLHGRPAVALPRAAARARGGGAAESAGRLHPRRLPHRLIRWWEQTSSVVWSMVGDGRGRDGVRGGGLE
ncbi:hypothetical protein I4F81_005623 [Pyropia yezoensis]|uniref:Uncharacterized protein n=1 Tax=Pyropia yezoensis TaxID=2788 RepID=A0ACC3BYD9_PYRYE|nr:hypothetical protein I4F81_005623 [Neopyropia yezoensis]